MQIKRVILEALMSPLEVSEYKPHHVSLLNAHLKADKLGREIPDIALKHYRIHINGKDRSNPIYGWGEHHTNLDKMSDDNNKYNSQKYYVQNAHVDIVDSAVTAGYKKPTLQSIYNLYTSNTPNDITNPVSVTHYKVDNHDIVTLHHSNGTRSVYVNGSLQMSRTPSLPPSPELETHGIKWGEYEGNSRDYYRELENQSTRFTGANDAMIHSILNHTETLPKNFHNFHNFILSNIAQYGNDEHRQRVLDIMNKHKDLLGEEGIRGIKYKLIDYGPKRMRELFKDDPNKLIRGYVKYPPIWVRND